MPGSLMRLDNLNEKRRSLIHQMRTLQDIADNEKRPMSAEEREQFDRIFEAQKGVKDEIEREKRLIEAENELRSTVETPAATPETRKIENAAKPTLKDDFRHFLHTGQARGEFRALQADSDPAGGYLVAPPEFSNMLIEAVDNQVFVRQLVRDHYYRLTRSDEIEIPARSTDIGDLTWTTELGTGSADSSLDFGNRSLKPKPLARRILVSRKLLRIGAINIEDYVRNRFAYKFATVEENAFINGTGANQPLGFMVADASGVNTDRDVSAAAVDALDADVLRTAKYTLLPQYRQTAAWFMHSDAVAQVSKLKDGNQQYLWREGIAASDPDMLLGMPIYESQYMPNTFTTGLYVACLADLNRGYGIADLQSFEIQVVDQLYAETNQVLYIARGECDGMPVLSEAFVRIALA